MNQSLLPFLRHVSSLGIFWEAAQQERFCFASRSSVECRTGHPSLGVGMPCLYSIFVSARPPSTAVLRWNSTGITIAGGPGASNTSALDRPYGLAFDSSKTLYFADYGHNRILKITGGTVVTIAGRADTVAGNAANELNLPVHVLFDSNDNLYIIDRANNRVQFWNNGATSGTTIAGMKGGEERRARQGELRNA